MTGRPTDTGPTMQTDWPLKRHDKRPQPEQGQTGNEWADRIDKAEPSEKKRDEARETPKSESRGRNRPSLPRDRIRP